MSEFPGGEHDEIGAEFGDDYSKYLIICISTFLTSRKHGEDFIDNELSIFGGVKKVPTETSAEIDFHSENMTDCKTLEQLEEYAKKNGLGWLNPEELKECEESALELMALDSNEPQTDA